jgi:hypothetical protein
MLADGFHQIIERGFEELGAGLERARDDLMVWDIPDAFQIIHGNTAVRRWGGGVFFDECCESFAECLCLFSHGGGSISKDGKEIKA